MSFNVVITAPSIHPKAKERLAAANCNVRYLSDVDSSEELYQILSTEAVDALIVRTLECSAELINSSKSLKVISRHGVGFNGINIDAASKRNIPVFVARGANSQAVAEFTISLMFSLARRVPDLNNSVKTGGWDRSLVGRQLSGSTLGLIGYGDIAKRVAAIAGGIGMNVRFFDPYLQEFDSTSAIQQATSLESLLSESDILSLHCPSSEENKHLINAERLALMQPHALLINTSRGDLIDEVALSNALQSGQLAGAGLDTLQHEPPSADHPFLVDKSILLSPHMGGSTDVALENTAVLAVENALGFLERGDVNLSMLVNKIQLS